MRKLLNTLYVTIPNAYLSKDGETVLVRVEQETRLRIPIHTLEGIVCVGIVSMSPPLMGFCAEHNVGVSFLSEHGRFLARIQGPIHGNVLLRREQYRRADQDADSAAIAKSILLAKIANSRTSLLRAGREHSSETIDRAATQLGQSLRLLASATSLDGLRGVEGDAAQTYFSVFDELILHQKEEFFFHGRSRRPPLDNVNCIALVPLCPVGARHRLRIGNDRPRPCRWLSASRPPRPCWPRPGPDGGTAPGVGRQTRAHPHQPPPGCRKRVLPLRNPVE